MHFGENQLSPSLLGLSPLSTGHPPCFQPGWVRSFTGSYPRFNLPMDRSLGFGSTSYHRVCLAFHPYPQVIPPVFNQGGFGPSRGLTPASTCPWIDHSASGLPAITEFAWPFTPIHRSSPLFSTRVGSVLHGVLPPLQPAHG